MISLISIYIIKNMILFADIYVILYIKYVLNEQVGENLEKQP